MSEVSLHALLIDGERLFGLSVPQEKNREPAFDGVKLSTFSFSDCGDENSDDLASALKKAKESLAITDGALIALPSDKLVARVFSLPVLDGESISSMVRLRMEKYAPSSDGEIEVAYEVIGASDTETRVFAVAIPLDSLNGLASSLEESGVMVTRIDSALLCEWESFKSSMDAIAHPEVFGVVFALPSGRFDLIIADGVGPVFARALGTVKSPGDLARELTLSLLDLSQESEVFPQEFLLLGGDALGDGYAASVAEATGVKSRIVPESAVPPYVVSGCRRDLLDGVIDIIPASWRDEERSAISKRRFKVGIVAALILWVFFAGAVFFGPKILAKKTISLDREIDAVAESYHAVSATRAKVRLIRSYEDRSLSALDLLKGITAIMPEGITFSSFTYDKGGELSFGKATVGGIKVAGDSSESQPVLSFKDSLDALGLFAPAKLTGPTMDGKRQRFKFEVDSRFSSLEEVRQ